MAENIKTEQWLSRNIDPASAGANLEAATTLGTGFDGVGASGLPYTDDIQQ